jgi:hypothetical protein
MRPSIVNHDKGEADAGLYIFAPWAESEFSRHDLDTSRVNDVVSRPYDGWG